MTMEAEQSTHSRLRAGLVSDVEFDALYSEHWQKVSQRYWTPVDVACQAAEWLTESGIDTVLDVGSGVGKLCLIGAAITPATFVGVEHRMRLVRAARAAAIVFGVQPRASFVHSGATLEILTKYRALYLYNPFGENLNTPTAQIDDRVELGQERYFRDIAMVEEALVHMPAGGRLVTYHGFGGRIPDNFQVEHEKPFGSDVLRLWIKSGRGSGGHFIETDKRVDRVPLRWNK